MSDRKIIQDMTLDEERALYGSDGIDVISCRFDGPADGESALKESRDIDVRNCYFNLRYPFWHDDGLKITSSEMTANCRAALWYTKDAVITDSKLHGIKALRECSDIVIENCNIVSPEFGWSVSDLVMRNSSAQSEYFFLRSSDLKFENVSLKGKYSFQYITDSVFENCNFDTKDSFWHAKDVIVRNSVIKGEYLAWYSEDVTFENCTIIGTQPLCYCKGLKLINCRMEGADLAFEKSEVDATILTPVISIKNPYSGRIEVPGVMEVIRDDENAEAEIIIASGMS
ncbi:MAG: DUF3737 family protein [Lachnospiraceae bacterium]|nr:DUF3737 family protein [Lachnospiraceae bacterium]